MERQHQRCVISFEPYLLVAHAPDLQRRLLDGFDSSSVIDLDLSAAEEIDVSFLQMLVAAQKTAKIEAKDLGVLAEGSVTLLSHAERCGIAPSELPVIRAA